MPTTPWEVFASGRKPSTPRGMLTPYIMMSPSCSPGIPVTSVLSVTSVHFTESEELLWRENILDGDRAPTPHCKGALRCFEMPTALMSSHWTWNAWACWLASVFELGPCLFLEFSNCQFIFLQPSSVQWSSLLFCVFVCFSLTRKGRISALPWTVRVRRWAWPTSLACASHTGAAMWMRTRVFHWPSPWPTNWDTGKAAAARLGLSKIKRDYWVEVCRGWSLERGCPSMFRAGEICMSPPQGDGFLLIVHRVLQWKLPPPLK